MKTSLLCCRMAVLWATVAYAQIAQKAPSSSPQRALVDQYCAGCHNDKLRSGNMTLSRLDLAHPGQNAELAEKVIRKVSAGMMPPAGMPRPSAAATKAFVTSLENGIDQAAALHPNPGRPALHRLNRTEYANSIRDLLAVDIDVTALLPTDDMSHGFDNMSDVLTVSPALMEGYIRAAGRISREAVGDTTVPALTSTYTIPRVMSQMRHVDGTPFGTRGGTAVMHDFPADGEYSFRLGFYYVPEGPLFGQNMGKGQQIEVAIDGARVALLDINPAMKLANDGIKVPPVHITAGPHRVSASFPMKFDGPVEDEFRPVEQSLVDVSTGNIPGMTSLPHLHELQITGPHQVSGLSDTPGRRKIFTCRPAAGSDELPCARKIISALARQAYRRPVNDSDLEGLLSFYQSGRNQGDFESGVRTAIQAIISGPEFVFRFERTPAGVAPGRNFRVSDLELASRLSYFLWSSAPDDQLLTVASQGRLRDPLVLEKQVRRMLADPRSESLATIFAGEWLHLQNLKDANPDLYLFPNFDRTLAQSMRRETELLFDSIMREDRNVLDLLTADYAFVDERLAKHYGIPNVLGNRFRRVPLTDPNRFGVLGEGSILTLTSNANRTSPVQRGKYVMEVLLGTPPPNPPGNVPALKENSDARTGKVLSKPLSVRERMEEHRSNPACASCHKMMDPIGFALENFDAVGVWRINDGEDKIDASGKMFDGAKLDGPASLRQAILNHSDSYLSTFTENLLAYGMGRVLETYDMPVVRAIRRDAAKNDNRFSSFVLGIVKSAPFQMRRAEESEPAATTAPMAGN
ncbi:MAG TPA: DUF1592 domain-containing protein [Bryobacteraceae bacterium]|nr:DUF1592 domain-containing protein [Bryobacteraceae bacterium]